MAVTLATTTLRCILFFLEAELFVSPICVFPLSAPSPCFLASPAVFFVYSRRSSCFSLVLTVVVFSCLVVFSLIARRDFVVVSVFSLFVVRRSRSVCFCFLLLATRLPAAQPSSGGAPGSGIHTASRHATVEEDRQFATPTSSTSRLLRRATPLASHPRRTSGKRLGWVGPLHLVAAVSLREPSFCFYYFSRHIFRIATYGRKVPSRGEKGGDGGPGRAARRGSYI